MTTRSKTSGVSDTRRSGDSGRALANAGEAWFAAATEWQREMIGFVSARLEKDAEAVREVMGCKNPADVTAIQSRWIEETLREYSSEMTKLMSLCTKAMNSGGRI